MLAGAARPGAAGTNGVRPGGLIGGVTNTVGGALSGVTGALGLGGADGS